ncbi:probable WRKY transcription factor 53 [Papaver somniferum]|uniref:probable WRKY transcription factor 53 n=1 Tax=Papaver somniferum TaxID=3469 RepID=UPI000E6F9E79|nr:probable WRKY transcription factor 53 [Papaver somniferum]
MENNSTTMISWEKKTLIIKELTLAKERVKQLEMHLEPSVITSGKLLITKISSFVENSLFILNGIKPEGRDDQPQIMTGLTPITQTESPSHSVTGSPSSGYESDLIADHSKMRKILPRWTEKIRVRKLMG